MLFFIWFTQELRKKTQRERERERERESAYRPLYLKSSPKLRSVVCPWCYDDFDSLMTISMCNSYGSSFVLFSRIPLLFLLHECIGLRKYSMLLSMFFFFFFFWLESYTSTLFLQCGGAIWVRVHWCVLFFIGKLHAHLVVLNPRPHSPPNMCKGRRHQLS